MERAIIFTRLPVIALEEAVSLYLTGSSIRRAMAGDMTNPASPLWSAASEIGKNFTSLNFTYYDRYNNVVAPATLANRNAIARIDIQLTVQTPSGMDETQKMPPLDDETDVPAQSVGSKL